MCAVCGRDVAVLIAASVFVVEGVVVAEQWCVAAPEHCCARL